MTLGWRVSVYRQVEDRAGPSADHVPTGVRVATLRAQVSGLAWLKDLAESNDAVHLSDNSGYPIRYTVRAQALLPVIRDGPPRAHHRLVVALRRPRPLSWRSYGRPGGDRGLPTARVASG